MKFVATEDISAPIDHVWSRVSDFEHFEARIRDRAAGVARSPDAPVSLGTSWSGVAKISGKTRDLTFQLSKLEPPTALGFEGGTDGMQITLEVELRAMTPKTTRLIVTTEAKARTLAARLLLQSAKLARQTLAKRYKGRVAAFAERVEKSRPA